MTVGEPTVNCKLADILDGMNQDWKADGEDRGRFEGSAKVADVLVVGKFLPVVIETEFEPATTVEADARKKLGMALKGGQAVNAVFAVRLPGDLRERRDDLESAVRGANLEFALHAGNGRFPTEGWLTGNCHDLCMYVRAATTINENTERYAEFVHGAISDAAKHIANLAPGDRRKISETLRQDQNEQTYNMAALVLANAIIFYESIAGHNNIPRLGPSDYNRRTIYERWSMVLEKVNYAPVFKIAKDILENMDSNTAKTVLTKLAKASDNLHSEGLAGSQDLAGTLIQKTITNRKRLAAFYTLPTTAALMAALVTPNDAWTGNWWNRFRVGDFACGTGTLLAAVYRQIIANAEAAGGTVKPHHRDIMWKVFVGRDVLPVSIHLAVATLSGIYTHTLIKKSNIISMSYGRSDTASGKKTRNAGRQYSLGSLDLMYKEMATLTPSSDIMVGGEGEESGDAGVVRGRFNIVVMNPPFVRSTNHAGDGRDKDIAPAFAAFGTTQQDQNAMKKLASTLLKGTCYDGNVGMGSAFAAIADRMLAPGGTLGLILPATALYGVDWKKLRDMLNQYYRDVFVFTLTDPVSSFSADTKMWECVIVCRKRQNMLAIQDIKKDIGKYEALLKRQRKENAGDADATIARINNSRDKLPKSRGTFITLRGSPETTLQALALAGAVRGINGARTLESEAYGGTALNVGDDVVGRVLDCPLHGHSWPFGNVWDVYLLQVVEQLQRGKLRVHDGAPASVDVVRLGNVADIGLLHRDITGSGSGKMRGPFKKTKLGRNPIYPALWQNNLNTQQTMTVEPDCELEAKPLAETDHINDTWAKARHIHINSEVRYHAQRMCWTRTEAKTLGGRSWPNILLHNTDHERALCVWGNSTLGILCYWATAGRQQAGRGVHSRSSLMHLPILDVGSLSDVQIGGMNEIFDKYCRQEMKPIALLDRCPVRHAMDAEMMSVLGLGGVDLQDLRRRLCDEPSMHGGRVIERKLNDGEEILLRVMSWGKDLKTTIYATGERVLIQTVSDDDATVESFTYGQIEDMRLGTVRRDGADSSTLTFVVRGLDGRSGTDSRVIENLPKNNRDRLMKGGPKIKPLSEERLNHLDKLYVLVRGKQGLDTPGVRLNRDAANAHYGAGRGTPHVGIPEREDTHNEFKETFSVPVKGGKAKDVKMEVAITVAAFANAKGGRLFVGVRDDGTVAGLKRDLKQHKNADGLEQAVSNFLDSKLGSLVDVEFGFSGDDYLVVAVPKSKKLVFTTDGDLYVRRGNTSKKLTPAEAADYQGRFG